MQHLTQLPVHVLKIAKPFVDALSGERFDKTALVAHGVIEMADALGLDTIAEGIEQPEQAEVLQRWGCRTGQGYLLGRPMEPDALFAHAGWDQPAAPVGDDGHSHVTHGPADGATDPNRPDAATVEG